MMALLHTPRQRRSAVQTLPGWVGWCSALALAYLVVPIVLMGTRVPWASIGTHLATPAAQDALGLSLSTAVIALIIDLALGIPLAAYLASSKRGVTLARILVTLPLSLPPVVAGIALLSAFGRRGPLGAVLDQLGIQLAFSTTAVILAQVFVSLPFLVVTLEAALRSRPVGLEQTALSLGATPSAAFFQITLPQVKSGLIRGGALAFSRCLGEFGATLTFAGSLQGVTRTMPLQIYLAREEDQAIAVSLAIVLVGMAILVLAITEWKSWGKLLASPTIAPHPQDDAGLRASETGSDILQDTLVEDGLSGSQPGVQPSVGAGVEVDGGIAKRQWDLQITLPPGSITAVMGHNGAGKSTLGHVIAGTLGLDRGQVVINDTVVDGPQVFVPSRDRHIAVVSQSPQLFGFMRVIDNVAAPLRWRGVSKATAKEQALGRLRAVGCGHLVERRASELSGGQAAKVALARALVSAPQVLILDEPTAALDSTAKAQVQRLIMTYLRHQPVTTLLITHDVVEALQLANRLAVMDHGRVVEIGDPVSLIRQPESLAGAKLAGLNVLSGLVLARQEGVVTLDLAGQDVIHGMAPDEGVSLEIGDWAAALFTPESVALYTEPAVGSPRSALCGRVGYLDQRDGLVTLTLTIAPGITMTARITTRAWTELDIQVGQTVWAVVKATQIRIVPIQPDQPR